jgi:diguanylate cyclase (GGDEF)-like protein
MTTEDQLRSHATILREALQQSQKKEVPAKESERLLNLLSLLVSSMGEEVTGNEDFSELSLEGVLNYGNLIKLIERQAAELVTLKHIMRNLTSTLDLQVVLDQVVREAMYLIKNSHEAHIYLYEDGNLVFGAALDENDNKNKQVSIPRPNGLSNSVARQKKLIIAEDMETHTLFINAPKVWKGSIIGIPLLMEERVVGIMNLVRSCKGEFTEPEIRLLMMLANQAAIAINNAHLHQMANRQARIDAVTQLPNRRALDERLEDAIQHSRHSGRPFSVVMMDLDGFKNINDTFGHDTGDDVLRQIANALKESLRTTDFLARYGGDEMTLILAETDLPQTSIVTQKIQDQLQNFAIHLPNEQTTRLSVSGGIALYPQHADTAPALLRAADAALYRAKKYARGTFVITPNQTGKLPAPQEPSYT